MQKYDVSVEKLMMEAPVRLPRNMLGIVVIALFLGGTCLMLWMGRWKAAVVQLLIVLAGVTFFPFNLASFEGRMGSTTGAQ